MFSLTTQCEKNSEIGWPCKYLVKTKRKQTYSILAPSQIGSKNKIVLNKYVLGLLKRVL